MPGVPFPKWSLNLSNLVRRHSFGSQMTHFSLVEPCCGYIKTLELLSQKPCFSDQLWCEFCNCPCSFGCNGFPFHISVLRAHLWMEVLAHCAFSTELIYPCVALKDVLGVSMPGCLQDWANLMFSTLSWPDSFFFSNMCESQVWLACLSFTLVVFATGEMLD